MSNKNIVVVGWTGVTVIPGNYVYFAFTIEEGTALLRARYPTDRGESSMLERFTKVPEGADVSAVISYFSKSLSKGKRYIDLKRSYKKSQKTDLGALASIFGVTLLASSKLRSGLEEPEESDLEKPLEKSPDLDSDEGPSSGVSKESDLEEPDSSKSESEEWCHLRIKEITPDE